MNRTYGLARTGSYLTTASMLVMMGRNDQNVMANSGLNKKDITSPFGCHIVDSPFGAKVKDQLAGEIREGKTILVTDLPYRIKTVTSSRDIGVGLGDMGSDIDVFKVLEHGNGS